MTLSENDVRELLAAEYVLGLLAPGVRLRLERWLLVDPALAASVRRWEHDLARLGALAPAEVPPSRCRRRLRAFLDNERPRRRLAVLVSSVWRYAAPLAVATSLFLVAVLIERVRTVERAPTGVAVLTGRHGHTRWMLTMGHDRMRVITVGRVPLPPHKSYELWFLPHPGAPMVPVGLLPTHGVLRARLSRPFYARLARARLLAVSLEPAGGSPTGRPTGPVLFKGTPQAV
jgi:anti-sigma-K factor RskA